MDNERHILETNKRAEEWMKELGFSHRVKSFEEVLGCLKGSGAKFQDAVEKSRGVDIYFSGMDDKRIYNMRERVIHAKDDSKLGLFVTCEDVTRNRQLIKRLEETAGVDSLTGLLNRRSYEEALSILDDPDNLPLTVIIGDVNGLKKVNDAMGHHQGDHLLRVVAELLGQCCPADGQVFRIGGDEYVMLLPNCPLERAKEILDEINSKREELRDYPFEVSIALGSATKEMPGQDLEMMVKLADMNMYARKRAR